MREQTPAVISGLVAPGQAVDFAAVSYERTLEFTSLIPAATVVSDCVAKLQLDGVDQAQTFTLGGTQKKVRVAVSPAIVIPAGVTPTAVCVTPGGAVDLVVWLESTAAPQAGEDEGWFVLTAGMLQSRISAIEYTQFTSSVIQGAQADPIPQILADIAQRVRAAVRSGNKVGQGPAGTIPASLKNAALTIAKYELFGRVTSLRAYLEVMEPAWKQANRELELVAKGEIVPESPTTVTEDPGASSGIPSPSFTDTKRKFTKCTEDGV